MQIMPFEKKLIEKSIVLDRGTTTSLQINVGSICNLACRHCHLEAGPSRSENMLQETVFSVISFAHRNSFSIIDITGGAPELNPNLPLLIKELAPLTPKLIVRTNLTALALREHVGLPLLYKKNRVALVASLPAVSRSQTDAQRGSGAWDTCIIVLKRLNEIGYGREGSGLELDLVSNPVGAFLPGKQSQIERRYREELLGKHGICFNHLYTFANAPLGRFRQWLQESGNLNGYLARLVEQFNAGTIPHLMCRSLISVNWDGIVYDCDFNLAAGIPHRGVHTHISDILELPAPGTDIKVGDHCYTCTAGSGFT